MLEYISQKSEAEILNETSTHVGEQLRAKVEEITVSVIISIYCTRGENFSAKHFKDALFAEGWPMIACHKVYALMNTWRNAASKPQVRPLVFPPTPAVLLGSVSAIETSAHDLYADVDTFEV
jgi:hypothetical protein